MVLIGIPAYGQQPLLQKLVNSINRCTPHTNVSIVIIDDGSPEPLQIKPGKIPVTILRNAVQVGFTASVNRLLTAPKLRFHTLVLLNSDMEVQSNWLPPILSLLRSNSNAGICGGIELSFPGKKTVIRGGMNPMFTHNGITGLGELKMTGTAASYARKKPFLSEWVSFGFTAITKKCIEATGLLDELQVNYFSDADYCYRARMKGFEIWTVPASRVMHRPHQSTKLFYQSGLLKLQADRERFLEKWMPVYNLQMNTAKDFIIQSSEQEANRRLKLIPHLVPGSPVKQVMNRLLEANKELANLFRLVTTPGFELQQAPPQLLSQLYTNGFIYFEKQPRPVIQKNWFGNKKTVLVSPHPDDIALSMGGTLLNRRYERGDMMALVVFSHSNYNRFGMLDARDNSYLRKFEDLAYFARLGIPAEFGNVGDCLLRRPGKSIYYPSARITEPGVHKTVYHLLKETVRQRPGHLYFFPLAAGLMSDHFIITECCLKLLKEGIISARQLMFYEDLPYVAQPGALKKIMTFFNRKKIKLSPVYSEVSGVFEKKLENLSVYFSQVNPALVARTDEYAFALTTEFAQKKKNGIRYERFWKPG